MILTGDCLELMPTLEAGSVDAVVTDPPYGIGFMGKAWDALSEGAVEKSWDTKGRKMTTATRDADATTPHGRSTTNTGYPAPNPRCGNCGRAINGRDTPKGFVVCHCDPPLYVATPNRQAQRSQDWHQRWATEAFRVAKPGAYLLAFGGTRTYHRLTCAIEDAGWIIRDCLVWAYACLSDDTEVLTSEGWVPYHKTNVGQLAAAFDPDSGELRWQTIEAVHIYDHLGPMLEVGPSLVTANHRVILDTQTARVPRLPGLWNDVRPALGVAQEGKRVVLLEPVQRQGTDSRSAVPSVAVMERRAQGAGVGGDAGSGQSGLEGRSYRVQEARQLLGSAVRPGAGMGASDGAERRLRHGTPIIHRRDVRVPVDQNGMRQPRGPRPDEQRQDQPDALAGQPDAQALRMGQMSGGDGKPDAIRRVDYYRGVVWCITVPSGAFVARRNGVVFVTGNSGFPKSRALLKPAWEPIVMARKPGPLRELAIDLCRIPGVPPSVPQPSFGSPTGAIYGMKAGEGRNGEMSEAAGRWPSNVLLTADEDGRGIFDGDTPGVVGGGQAATGGNVRPYKRANRGGFNGPMPERVDFELDRDSGTYSRFFMLPRSAPLSGRMGTCERCGAPIAGLSASSDTRASDAGSAPSPASAPSASTTPLSGQLAFDAGSPSPSPATSTAPRRVPTPPDGKRASTANVEPFPELSTTVSDTSVIARGSLSEPTPGIASLSDQPARTAELPPTSTGITTTTASPLMCERCADDAIHGRTLPPPKLTGRAPLPVDGDDYTRFLILPKAARSEREPVLGGLPTRDDSRAGSFGLDAARPHTSPDYQYERKPRANSHPTVKPLDLMRHLVRLVTPTGGTVLDPFAGSGTTLLAAELEGFPWIGIEREAEYVAIIEARLNGTQRGLGLDVGAPIPRTPNTHPDLSKHQPKRRAAGDNWSGAWKGTLEEEPA